jgi:nucleotide-binding universal stress UspA family protein
MEAIMALRVITARITGAQTDGAVLDGALALSRATGGHIEALFARPDPRMVVAEMDGSTYPGFYDEMLSVLERQWTNVANKALKTFDKWREQNQVRTATVPDDAAGPSIAWREMVGAETDTLARRGRVSDILVSAMPSRRHQASYDLGFEAALLNSGRPVLLVPRTIHNDLTGGTAIVAWNGSMEAARAVAAALPILEKTRQVLIFTASEGRVEASLADELVTYLKWHGINASALETDSNKTNSVEEALLSAVRKHKPSLIVMGAYTHSRFKEILFGGVTRHVFENATVPVLMAH